MRSSRLVSRSCQHLRIHHVDGRARRVREYLVEDLGELDLIFLVRHVAYVRRAHDVVEAVVGEAFGRARRLDRPCRKSTEDTTSSS